MALTEKQKENLTSGILKMRSLIEEAKKLQTEPANKQRFFDVSQDIFHVQAYFIGLMVEAKRAYRERVKELVKGGSSHAAAETEAESEDAYCLYLQGKMMYELAAEEVMLIKKLLGISEYELRNS